MKTILSWRSRDYATLAILLTLILGGSVEGTAQGLVTLDAIVAAHGAGPIAPISVQMIGIVERGGKAEPFRILATRDEELRIEYGTSGTDARVVTSKFTFTDNGVTSKSEQAGSGFSQLDRTGLFLVQQLRNRTVKVDLTDEWALVAGVRARRIRVSSDRVYKIPGRQQVDDRLDLYATDAGLIAGISRTLYEGRPERYTATWTFSDYRQTEAKVLLPHRIELYVNNKKRESFAVASYSFDVLASRELFRPRGAR